MNALQENVCLTPPYWTFKLKSTRMVGVVWKLATNHEFEKFIFERLDFTVAIMIL